MASAYSIWRAAVVHKPTTRAGHISVADSPFRPVTLT